MSEEREIVRQTAGMVAAEMGKGWTVDTSEAYSDHFGAYLDGPDGARLFMRLDWRNSDRLTVDGVYPPTQMYGLEGHGIGVKRERGPAVIAREISRRLLPTYLDALARVQEHNADRADAGTARAAVAAELAAVVRGTVDTPRQGDTSSRVRWYASGAAYGHFELNYRGTDATVELRSVPIAVVRQIAQLIADAR